MIDYGFGVKLGPLSKVPQFQMLEWRNNPLIYKWCRQNKPLEDWEHEGWFASLPGRTDLKMYGIFSTQSNNVGVFAFLGICGLTSIEHINSRAEFSLYIGPEHQKNGYGENALKTLCKHGFETLNLNSIWGESFDGNPAIKTFEKLGFKKEGTRRQFYFREGKYIDAHIYSLLRSECDFN